MEKSYSLFQKSFFFFFKLVSSVLSTTLSGIPASICKHFSEDDTLQRQFSYIPEEWKPNWILPSLCFFLFNIGLGKCWSHPDVL